MKAENAFAEKLQQGAAIQIYLATPSLPLSTLLSADHPTLGPPSAPVTIIEFTDFACPSCATVHPILKQLYHEFSGKVRLVARDFPLAKHVQAFKAAEAAQAANAQGKY